MKHISSDPTSNPGPAVATGTGVYKEILVNVLRDETRVALVENGSPVEIRLERESQQAGLVGNIYLGRVQRVLPGMQAAFVEIGLARTAFLHLSDMAESRRAQDGRGPRLNALLQEGQQLLVQIVKDPIGSKGARLTTDLSIPSRYVVYLPRGDKVGVSTRIEAGEERERLRKLLQTHVPPAGQGGYIIRTAGEGVEAEALQRDLEVVHKLWTNIQDRAAQSDTGSLVYGDLPIATRILRDLMGPEVARVRIDCTETWRQLQAFAAQVAPELAERIERYEADAPIFDLYDTETALQQALQPQVPLKSGGYLVIEQTEAMVTIDVNTGAYLGRSNLEQTLFRTNLEAAQTIARQLRLRNLGGIIVIDFIDMQSSAHRERVLAALNKALAGDPARTAFGPISPLGLLEMTRKRTRESLEHLLCEPCPNCNGSGNVKTAASVCREIFREILRAGRQFESAEFLLLAAPDVIALLVDEESGALAELAESVGKTIRLQSESMFAREQFELVPI